MTDIIQLLPDSVANQIAAGEVIQRPASVVKELIENAIDAEADEIILNIKDAGRTLVQVIDNGKGMSETDARMAFERHATSKIRKAEDLFGIHTMGFRGEALASIAAVADVELKTKARSADLGTLIHIKGSLVKTQETVACSEGSTFSVRNLFFNIPARRKFLKTDATEFKHILSEFKKTALANPHIAMQLYHNEQLIHRLDKSDLLQRIGALFGRAMKERLVPAESQTEFLHIYGYTGKAETAKKRNDEQYFFVNKRFMKHPYFHKALLLAYEQILKPGAQPSYFLFFDIAPEDIDINIHPAKIEINFENAPDIFKMLRATIREALGKFSLMPSIDFDRDGYVPLPKFDVDEDIKPPSISNNHSYNPFNEENSSSQSTSYRKPQRQQKEFVSENWEKLYVDFESGMNQPESQMPSLISPEVSGAKLFQYKNNYIVTPVKSGVMFIHIARARERIFFEMLLRQEHTGVVQNLLYSVDIQLNMPEVELLKPCLDEIKKVGFDLHFSEEEVLSVTGVPAFFSEVRPKMLVESLIARMRDDVEKKEPDMRVYIAEVFAQKAAMGYQKTLLPEEMQYIVNELFALENPEFSPTGKKSIHILKDEEIVRNFGL